jgi:hypothetical protein
MKKVVTGPMQFTSYQPWSEERKSAARRRFALKHNPELIKAIDELLRVKAERDRLAARCGIDLAPDALGCAILEFAKKYGTAEVNRT